MGRPLSSSEHADAARRLLKETRTAYEMRLAQSLLLPLELGLTVEQTYLGREIDPEAREISGLTEELPR